MHLALVSHTISRNDGQGRVNYEIARAALARGDRVTLLASSVAPDLVEHERARRIRIPVDGWPSALLRNQVFAVRSALWLRRNTQDIDVTLANGFITWASADVNAAHFVHSAWRRSEVHTARIRSGPMAWYQWLYTALNARWERHAFAQAQIVVAVSERVEAELIAAGVPADCIRTIPNGVDLDEFAPGPVDRSALGLPPSVPLALFVGDLQTPRKNLDTVLQAVSVLPELHLAVAGGTNGSPYPALAEQLGISDRVHFLGFRSDVADLMRAANVCVCPSRYEPFSLVLLEALASGCPVVTTHSVGAAPIVTPACGAVLDDPEDAVALAEALQRIAVGPSLASAETFRRAARSAASAYPWSRTATAYLNALDAIAPPGSSSNASVPTVATPAQT